MNNNILFLLFLINFFGLYFVDTARVDFENTVAGELYTLEDQKDETLSEIKTIVDDNYAEKCLINQEYSKRP